MTEVVAALIWKNDRFLACQRPVHKARGLLWEFVGGKVEPGETKEEALIRECREELAVTVQPGTVFMELTHVYPDLTVHLTLFNARILQGEPQMLEHNAIKWMTTGEIPDYSFCPADEEILRELMKIQNGLQAELLALSEPDYRDFQCSLMPTVSRDRVIGVRIPALRKIAARMNREGESGEFLKALPHRFFEEDILHAIMSSGIQDPIPELERFLPYVDNWSVCDTLAPKAFRKEKAKLISHVQKWLQSEHSYTVRFAMGVLMRYFLDDCFSVRHLQLVADSITEDYYVKMMAAWYYATALAKQYDYTVTLLEENRLPVWVHNKTIQKAVESFRVTEEHKNYLRTLRKK